MPLVYLIDFAMRVGKDKHWSVGHDPKTRIWNLFLFLTLHVYWWIGFKRQFKPFQQL